MFLTALIMENYLVPKLKDEDLVHSIDNYFMLSYAVLWLLLHGLILLGWKFNWFLLDWETVEANNNTSGTRMLDKQPMELVGILADPEARAKLDPYFKAPSALASEGSGDGVEMQRTNLP